MLFCEPSCEEMVNELDADESLHFCVETLIKCQHADISSFGYWALVGDEDGFFFRFDGGYISCNEVDAEKALQEAWGENWRKRVGPRPIEEFEFDRQLHKARW